MKPQGKQCQGSSKSQLAGGDEGKAKEPVRTFEDLECWKTCRTLRMFVASEVIPALPKEERYRIGDQLLRAARSTTANMAEGYGRFHYLDNARFCSNSRGSCWEVLDHLITASDEKLITRETLQRGRELASQAVRILSGYMNYPKRAHQPRAESDAAAGAAQP